MRANAALAVLPAFASLASAVIYNNLTNPNEVALGTRASWCTAQRFNCKNLCLDTVNDNNCDPVTLIYSCLCGNGSAPGLEYYTDTIPTFVCNQLNEDCIVATQDNALGQLNCTKTFHDNCGTRNATLFHEENAGSTTTSTTAPKTTATSAGGTQSSTGAANNAGTTSRSSSFAQAANLGYLGNGIAIAAAGAFAVLL